MTMIYTGRPAPLDGKRALSVGEASQRAKAMACVRAKSTQCQGQVHVGLFFDGTGNNRNWVEDGQDATQFVRNKHSNVARLFDAYSFEPESGFFRYYMPGVGTPFKEIGDTSKFWYDFPGMGMGYMGADRINWGITSIFNAVHAYLYGSDLLNQTQQRALVNTISKDILLSPISTEAATRWAGLTSVEENLAAVVKGHQRKVLQINVSIFGFSRGAAQARACAYWLSQICERNGGGMTLAGIPLRIGFMGIFDTVAAVGIGDVTPFTDGHMAWADGTQAIHPAVEDCTHFIALHEQRASFPLEAAVGRGNVGYPGMHSDVGGGYCPGEQGKAMPEWGDSPHLSQIPLMDMHFAAIKAGVPMKTIEEIKAIPQLAKSFATDERLIKTYNTWLAHQGVKGGDIRSFTQAHAHHYMRWRGSLHGGRAQRGVARQEFFKRSASAKDRALMGKADDDFALQLRWLLERREANATIKGYMKERLKDAAAVASLVIRPPRMPSLVGVPGVEFGKAPLSSHEHTFLAIAADGPLPPTGCADLFSDYVHDSRAGFTVGGSHEPSVLTGGYLRFRHVFKEEIHGESRVYGWANEGLSDAKAAGNAVIQFLSDLWDATTETYERVRARINLMGRQTAAAVQQAASAYQSAQMRVWRQCQQAEKELLDSLAERYREYSSPEAVQRRQWDREAAEYARTKP